MKHIDIIAVGKSIPRWAQDVTEEYEKRLTRFVKIRVFLIPISNASCVLKRQEDEGKAILTKCTSPFILCDSSGLTPSSKDLAKMIEPLSSFAFVLGGPDGVSEDIKTKAKFLLSFSSLTLPHHLARIFLFESIYRSMCILSNHPYHK